MSFILFNIRYIKQRRVKKLHIEENSIELDENVLMLISTTEEGTRIVGTVCDSCNRVVE